MTFSEVYFQRLGAVIVFWQPETVVQTKRHFIMFFATNYFLPRGFCARHFERGKGRGNEVNIADKNATTPSLPTFCGPFAGPCAK